MTGHPSLQVFRQFGWWLTVAADLLAGIGRTAQMKAKLIKRDNYDLTAMARDAREELRLPAGADYCRKSRAEPATPATRSAANRTRSENRQPSKGRMKSRYTAPASNA